MSVDKNYKVALKISGWNALEACAELEPSEKCTVKTCGDGDVLAWYKIITFTAKTLKEFKKALSL